MIKYENKDADRDDGDDDDNDSNVWEFLVIEKLLSINGQLECVLAFRWKFPFGNKSPVALINQLWKTKESRNFLKTFNVDFLKMCSF